MTGAPWPPERVTRLTDLWTKGASAGLIGKKLGVSKNAVVGKAHRLQLPGRPSPILHQGTAEERRRAALARGTGRSVMPVGPQDSEARLSPHGCLFIKGEKGKDFALYAEAPRCPVEAMSGSSYCPDHHRLTRIKRQTEEAA